MSNNVYLAPSPVDPPFLTISNITNAAKAVITVIETNSYVTSQLIHLSIPADYGMAQADQLTGQILAISGLNFTTDINTTLFNAFVYPPTSTGKPATLSPAGSRNLYNFVEVPFHSQGNTGN